MREVIAEMPEEQKQFIWTMCRKELTPDTYAGIHYQIFEMLTNDGPYSSSHFTFEERQKLHAALEKMDEAIGDWDGIVP